MGLRTARLDVLRRKSLLKREYARFPTNLEVAGVKYYFGSVVRQKPKSTSRNESHLHARLARKGFYHLRIAVAANRLPERDLAPKFEFRGEDKHARATTYTAQQLGYGSPLHKTMVERPEDWTTDSTSALSLHLCDGQESILQPKWTYALFGETEQIFGYKKLRIRLYMHALTLRTWLDVRYEEKLAVSLGVDMESVEEILLNHLPPQTKVCINGSVASSDASQLKDVDVATWKTMVDSESRSGTRYEKPIHTYTRAGKTFAILKMALPDSQDCISWMQIFSLLYIEGASLIDEEDERFDVFVVYETQDGQPIRFVGYCTCYKYYFYDKATHAFDVVRYRISQFLTLPHFQKQGHGGQLYDTIFADCQSDPKVLEVTVEDPSEAFDDLRDRRDFSRLLREATLDTLAGKGVIPSLTAINDASRKAKVAPAQFRRMLELYLLRQASVPHKGKQPASNSFGRQLRLFIKRRIYKKNASVLKLLDPSERKKKLAETYSAQVEDYRRILKSLKLEPARSATREAGRGTSDGVNGTAEPASKRIRVE